MCYLMGIWLRYDTWVSGKLKFDYLKNNKSFWSEMKNFFLCFLGILL